jgi:hypothetical protein
LPSDDFMGQLGLLSYVLHCEQRAGMTGRDMSRCDHLANTGRKQQHAKQICDRRPIFPHRLGDLLLCQLELLDQALITLCLLEGIQIRALQILDEREREHGAIIEIVHDGGNLGPAKSGRRTKSALSGNELPSSALSSPNRNWLQEAVRPN